MNKIIFFISFCFLFSPTIFAQNFWQETNGPDGGMVQCIAKDKAGIIWAGFQAGQYGPEHYGRGLYNSTDNGSNWQTINFYGNKDVQSITIDTSGNIYIWVLGNGVIKSTNNGLSWMQSSPIWLSGGFLNSFNNNYLVLGMQDGLYFSTNSGQTWVLNSLSGSFYYVYVDKDDNVYALKDSDFLYRSSDYGISWSLVSGLFGVKSMTQLNNSALYAGTYYGVYLSRNGGENWIHIPNSPQNVVSIFTDENNKIFVGTYSKGFYVSTDYGFTWEQRNNKLTCKYITTGLCVSTDNIILGTRGSGFYKTSDEGLNWYKANNGVKSVTITSFIQYNQYLFAGSENGIIFKTSDFGNSWEMIDSIYTTLAINSFTKTSLGSLFFCSNQGVFKSSDGGNTWMDIPYIFSYKLASYFDLPSNVEFIFALGLQNYIYRSTDDGSNWELINTGIPVWNFSDIKINSEGVVFVTSSNDIFRSTDFGNNWDIIYEGDVTVYQICLSVSPNNYLYAGFDWGKVKLSTDNGASWHDRGQYLTTNRINSIATDLLNRVYVGNWWGQIYQSLDNGINWLNIRSGMNGGPVFNLYCTTDGGIYVGAYGGGVFRGSKNTFVPPAVILHSPAPGARNQPLSPTFKWFYAPSSLSYNFQLSLTSAFDSTSLIYNLTAADTSISVGPLEENTRYYWRVAGANQYGSGFWSNPWTFITQSTTGIQDTLSLPNYFELSQNYPNPFNPATTIKFALPVLSKVKINIYNTVGQLVETLVDKEMEAGYHEVNFDASGLASGVYLYQLQAGDFVSVKKMLLIK